MGHYKSIIAYDGTDFKGFQRQKSGLRTVQAVLEDALREVGWKGISLKAAGRTDSGVHARGQVVGFGLEWKHGPGRLTRALNANLPSDVSVRQSEVVAEGFHPRFSALRRRYAYSVLIAPVRDPLLERFAWRVWPAPTLSELNAATSACIGEHDFAAFGSPPGGVGRTIREVYEAHWLQEGDKLTFVVEANAFLHRMVRRIVAASVQVGMGRIERSSMIRLLDDPAQRWSGRMAPPHGLCLERVTYPGDLGPGKVEPAG